MNHLSHRALIERMPALHELKTLMGRWRRGERPPDAVEELFDALSRYLQRCESVRLNSPLRRWLRESEAPPPEDGSGEQSAPPRWDGNVRALWTGRTVLKQFARRATEVMRVLEAFEEEGWPTHIDDPLPCPRGTDAAARLRGVVRRLNECQEPQRIRFRSDGCGEGVCWEWREDE